VYEQVLVAALDVGDSVIASACLEALESKFPDSSRVKRSKGMLLESEGKYDEAIALYDSVLAKQPSNLLMLKRKVCVHKSRGDTRAVIVALNKILELNAADVSTWVELAEVYAAECDQEAAAFCLEEAVMLTPTNAAIHTRLADFYYSIGGRDGLVKARKHYSTALNFQNLRSGNLRALYGLIMTCRSLTPLLSSAVEAADELALTKELHAWASEELKVYANQFDITGVGNIISVACATFEAK
jgi:tetratricopeptide (TPR) repeat protein